MQSGERADQRRLRIYDHLRDEWQPEIYDVALEPEAWPDSPKRAGVRAADEPHDERRSGSIRGRRVADPTVRAADEPHDERRSGSIRGRRAADSVVRSERPPIAVPIRLFEPDFQHQTIHQPTSGNPAEVSSAERPVAEPVDEPVDEPDRPDAADLSRDGDSARAHEPAVRQP